MIMNLAPWLACLLRRTLLPADLRLLMAALRRLRVHVIPSQTRELDLVLAILEDTEEESAQEFQEMLALARSHLARTFEN